MKVVMWVFVVMVVLIVGFVIWASVNTHSQLGVLIKNARYGEQCEKIVPMSGVPGFPIPIKTPNSEEIYQIFFFSISPGYPVKGVTSSLRAPSVTAELRRGDHAVCSPLIYSNATIKDNYGPRFSPEAEKLSINAIIRRQEELYLATEKVADHYFNDESGADAKAVADDFYNKFVYLSEPGFKEFYYNLNPLFWQWIEKLTGKILVSAPESTMTAALNGLVQVPEKARPFLPSKGILFLSGGLTSYARRVIVDLDKQTISFAEATTKGGSTYADMNTSVAPLTQVQIKKITSLINEISSSKNSFTAERPMLDFNVVLFLVKDGVVKVINSFGPPVGEVSDLYYYLWRLLPAIE